MTGYIILGGSKNNAAYKYPTNLGGDTVRMKAPLLL